MGDVTEKVLRLGTYSQELGLDLGRDTITPGAGTLFR